MKLQKRSVLQSMMLVGLMSAAAPVFAEPVELEVHAWKGGGSEPAGFPDLIAKFEQQNPGIEINLTYMSRSDTATVMPARLQSGDAPDVLMVDPVLARNWGKPGLLMDLSDQFWASKLTPAAVVGAKFDDKLYVMPTEFIGVAMYANVDLLKKAGLSGFPANIDEFATACHKLKEAGITPMLMPAKSGWTPGIFMTALGLAAGEKAAPDFNKDLLSGKIKFSEAPTLLASVKSLKTLADAGCYDAVLNLGVDPWSLGLSEFAAGKVAFLPQGAWNIQAFTNGGTKLNYEFGPFPALTGTVGVAPYVMTTGWAIPASAKHVDAAKKWLDFWAQDENLSVYLKAEAAFSPFQGATNVMPSLAEPYMAALKSGGVVIPEGSWSEANVMEESTFAAASYLGDLNQDPAAILGRLDAKLKK